jgi:uncharacterized protein YutE (UPF0331/DUF86 family)
VGALDFTANVIGSLAWPIVIVVLIVILRGQVKRAVDAIIDLIPGIKEITAAGVSVKLGNEVRAVVDKAESISASITVTPAPPAVEGIASPEAEPKTAAVPGTGDAFGVGAEPASRETELDRVLRYQQLAIDAPNAAILAMFSELEGLVRRNYVRHFAQPMGKVVSFGKMVTNMSRVGIVSDDAAEVLRQLSNVRNEVAHTAVQSTADVATDYGQAVANMVDYLIAQFERARLGGLDPQPRQDRNLPNMDD